MLGFVIGGKFEAAELEAIIHVAGERTVGRCSSKVKGHLLTVLVRVFSLRAGPLVDRCEI
jgi:hypothetical protein